MIIAGDEKHAMQPRQRQRLYHHPAGRCMNQRAPAGYRALLAPGSAPAVSGWAEPSRDRDLTHVFEQIWPTHSGRRVRCRPVAELQRMLTGNPVGVVVGVVLDGRGYRRSRGCAAGFSAGRCLRGARSADVAGCAT
jgi:hypothetical protein